jgi:hypothetical protein
MGQYATAWVVYGFAAPQGLAEQDMEDALKKGDWPDAVYLMAGPYGQLGTAYVVTFAQYGTTREAEPFRLPAKRTENSWTAQLVAVAKANGWPRPHCQWLVLADVS